MPSLADYTDFYPPADGLPVAGNGRPRVVIQTPRPPISGFDEETSNSLNEQYNAKPDNQVDDSFSAILSRVTDKLLGAHGQERYQLWPEKVIREGLSGAHDVMTEGALPPGLRRENFTDVPAPSTPTNDSTWLGKTLGVAPVGWQPNDAIVEKAQAMSALAGSGGLGGVTDATLGAGPFLRPALKYKDKLYKGKEGQQHLDVLPNELYPEFQRKAMSGEDINDYKFGFYNDKGQFLDREKALEYGINTGLIDPHAGKFGALTSTMFADSSKPGTAIEAMAKTNQYPMMVGSSKKGSVLQAYHGTVADFNKFNSGSELGVHFGTLEQANSRLTDIGPRSGSRIIPVEIEMKNPLRLDDGGDFKIGNTYSSLLKTNGIFSKDEIKEAYKKALSEKNINPFRDLIKSKGYDGVVYLNKYEGVSPEIRNKINRIDFNEPAKSVKFSDDELRQFGLKDSYIVFEPNTVKSRLTGATLFADSSKEGAAIQANKPTFYSALEHQVNNIGQGKMTGEQWLGTLGNKPGVKPEELDWTGLKDFLAERGKQPVTKQEVNDYLAANKVELKEVNKGEMKFNKQSKYALPEVIKAAREAGDTPGDLELVLANDGNAYRALTKKFPELSKNEDWAEVVSKDVFGGDSMPSGTTKYHNYQLPGGENYREMLLTLPDRQAQLEGYAKLNRLTEAERKELIALQDKNGVSGRDNYRSSHWDEPNILAHVRMNDRVMQPENETIGQTVKRVTGKDYADHSPDDQMKFLNKDWLAKNKLEQRPLKSLHLEEIQSDWHQQGRDRGYKGNGPTAVDLERATNTSYQNLTAKLKEAQPDLDQRAIYRLADSLVEKVREGETDSFHTQVEHDLAKQFVDKEAAYLNHSVAAEQAMVPDAPFKKTWHELALKRMLREAAEKGYDRLSWTPGEAQAARYDLSKQVDKLSYYPTSKRLVAANGRNVVIDRDGISPEQLSDYVGKEAAKKLLENPTNKIELSGTGNYVHQLEGEQLKIGGEGMKGFYDQIIPKSLEKLTKEHGVKVKSGEINSKYILKNKYGHEARGGATEAEANAELIKKSFGREDEQWKVAKEAQPVHYIDIPQSLKDQVLRKGQPLFSSQYPALAFVPVDGNPFESKSK